MSKLNCNKLDILAAQRKQDCLICYDHLICTMLKERLLMMLNQIKQSVSDIPHLSATNFDCLWDTNCRGHVKRVYIT